jgi:hypothetical protein
MNTVRHFAALCVSLYVFLPVAATQAAPTFANGTSLGTVSFSELEEASGVVASRNNGTVLWTHNDKGDSARIFALDTQGRKLGNYTLTGGSHVDYEDIGIGPGPLTNVLYLYVGDIGDGDSDRSNIKVYQIPEPAVYTRQSSSPVTVGLKGTRTITLTYPDGARDAEAMFIDPLTGDLFIATKASTSRIYTATKAQLDASTNITLSFVRTLAFDSPSGADISATGTEIIIRQEDFAKLWTRSAGQSISDALAGTAVTVPVIGTSTEPNGEAIGFDAVGSGYFTLSDDASSQPLYYFERTSSDGPDTQRTLVGAGSTWNYLDDGSDQLTAWRAPGFDDSAWSSGQGQFGYGDDDEQTVMSYGEDANNKHITTYFRTTFQLEDLSGITNLFLKVLFNDGASVYLNGVQVVAANLPTNANWNTLATATQTDLEDTWFSYAIPPSLLAEGSNTIAAEVHQAAGNSPDLSFDLQLIAIQVAGAPAISTQPAPQVTSIGDDASFSVEADGLAPFSYQWKKNAVSIIGGTNATLTIINAQTTDAGTYSVVVSNAYGTATSQNAALLLVVGNILLSEDFSDEAYNNQSLPESAKWYTSSSGGIGLSSGTLEADPGRMALAFFKDSGVQSIAVGKQLSASFTLNFSSVGNSSSGFRFGFFNSNGASRPADVSDSAFSGYDGCIVTTTARYPDSSAATSGSIVFRKRNPGVGGKLLGTIGGGYYSDVATSPATDQSFVAGFDYTVTLTIARTAADAFNLSVAFAGGSLSDYSFTVNDIAGIVSAFDGFAILSTQSNGSTYTIDDVMVVYDLIPTSVDSVGDGIPDWWRAQYFGGDGSTTNADSSATNDFDNDGLDNLGEYFADTIPTNGQSRLAFVSLSTISNDVQLVWIGGSAAWQSVQRSENLADTNGWSAIYTNSPPSAVTNLLLDTQSTNGFYRIEAWR